VQAFKSEIEFHRIHATAIAGNTIASALSTYPVAQERRCEVALRSGGKYFGVSPGFQGQLDHLKTMTRQFIERQFFETTVYPTTVYRTGSSSNDNLSNRQLNEKTVY